jgi:formate-dependent nitrite reductase membrane component NrfD
MVQPFTVLLRRQEEWSSSVALDLFLGGLGGALFLLSQLWGSPRGALAGIGLVCLGALVLLLHLGKPVRFWRAAFRPRSSWISRGVIAVNCLILFGLLSAAQAIGWLPQAGLAGSIVQVIAALAALVVIIYPGFLLSSSPSIPFWQTPLLPILFLAFSMVSGAGLYLFTRGAGEAPVSVRLVALGLLSLALLLLWVHIEVMRHSGLAARASSALLLRGELSLPFLLGVNAAGLVLPLLLLVAFEGAGASIVAGLLILCGAFLFRYTFLKAGVYGPPV